MLRKLLLVDDDYDECYLFESILKDIDPKIACYYACNGKDAVEKLENKDIEIPDVCFVDINMPIMNGWAFIDCLLQTPQYKSISIIVYSTSSLPKDILKAKELGVSYFIKPNIVDELRLKLETLYTSTLPIHLDIPE